MLIEIADKSGFCFGVERAIRLTEAAAEKYGELYTLGPLIHNRIVTDSLQKKGIKIADDVKQAAGKPLVIRSHGVTEDIEKEALAVCSDCIDATCPFVKKIHRIVERESLAGKRIIIIGNDKHPEVEGIKGWVNGQAVVIETIDEAHEFTAESNDVFKFI